MVGIRFHGRGGQGAKIASRILGRSGFLSGLYAQDFALFGAERRGAPVIACTRIGDHPIDKRGYLDDPDILVVMDKTLMSESRSQIFQGARCATLVLVNGCRPEQTVNSEQPGRLIYLDLTAIARRLTGHPLVSAAAAGMAAKYIPVILLEHLLQAVRAELGEFGLAKEQLEKNLLAANEAYALSPAGASGSGTDAPRRAEAELESVPYLTSAQFYSSTIRHGASAELRNTGNWRMERPEIALERCKRCFLCYLYCPDAAIHLDRDNYPHIDYEHCKGCLICREECPTDAITGRLEA